ncbi:MAG: hypothetical protein WC197_02290 [Candidatus Gastranaerophilaceae bacterium]|jgi:hypothetical protein
MGWDTVKQLFSSSTSSATGKKAAPANSSPAKVAGDDSNSIFDKYGNDRGIDEFSYNELMGKQE